MAGTALSAYLKNTNLTRPDAKSLASDLRRSSSKNEKRGGGNYLTFSGKTDIWKMKGKKLEDDDLDEVFLLEPASFVEGWTCWKKSEVADRNLWSLKDADEKEVFEDELEDHGPYEKASDGWKWTLGFGFVKLDETNQETVAFTNNSASGVNSIDDIKNDIADRADAGEPYMPLFNFTSERFKAHGEWNYKPMFEVHMWTTPEAVDAFYSGELTYDQLLDGDQPGAKKKPAARKRRSSKAKK